MRPAAEQWKRLAALVERRLDDSLTDEEGTELQGLLGASGEALGYYLGMTDIHCDLDENLGERADTVPAFEGDEEPVAASRPARRRPARMQGARRGPVRWGAWLSVAACLAIVAGALVINYRRAGRFADVLVARVGATTKNVTIVRDGERIVAFVDMKIRIGDRIETKNQQRATIVYDGEDTEIGVREHTRIGIGEVKEGKQIRMDAGAIDARVAPQPEGKPMVITTADATAEVRGTVLTLAVDADGTRLEVAEGLVRLTRLSDGEHVDVAAGHCAVAAEGVELAAIEMPEKPGTAERPASPQGERPMLDKKIQGEIIFEDDLANGPGDNWDIVIGTPQDGYTAVTENRDRYWTMGLPRFGSKAKEVCIVNARPGETRDRYVGIRSRKPIDAERFIVEAQMSFEDSGQNCLVLTEGLEMLEKDGILVAEWISGTLSRGSMWYRWAFAPAKRTPEEGMLARRYFINQKGRNQYYVRPTSRRILLATSNVGACIYRVRVRRLPEDYDVE